MLRNHDDDSLLEKANAAFRQAAAKVIQKAKQTGTSIILWENGKLKRIRPEDFELPAARPENPNPVS